MSLKEARTKMGFSPNAFARKCHLETLALAAYESGDRLPTWDAAWRIAKVLGMDPEDVDELRAAIEAVGKVGDPCDYCPQPCPGVKCLPQMPRSGTFSISLPCAWCRIERTYRPPHQKHTKYCWDCGVQVQVIERLEAMDNEFARLLGAALSREHKFLSEACAEAKVQDYTVRDWTAPGFAFKIHSPEAIRLAEVLHAPELLTALGFDQLPVNRVLVKCPNPDNNPKCHGDRWWRGGAIRRALDGRDPLQTLDFVDWNKGTAVMLCKSCSSARNSKAMGGKIKERGFWVDAEGNVFPRKRRGAKWVRGTDALALNLKVNSAGVTKEQRDEWRAKAQESRPLGDSKKDNRQRMRTSLGHMVPDPQGTIAPCWGCGCGLLAWSTEIKLEGAPIFHQECIEWPPGRPDKLQSYEYYKESLAMAINYAQFLQKLPSGKGKSAYQMAKENRDAGKEPATLKGVGYRIYSFIRLLPPDGRGHEQLARWSRVLKWAFPDWEKNESKETETDSLPVEEQPPTPAPVDSSLRETDLAVDGLVQQPRAQKTVAVAKAERYLEGALSEGWRPAKEVLDGAKANGIAERTLDRAKKNLGIQSVQVKASTGKRGGTGWVWRLSG